MKERLESVQIAALKAGKSKSGFAYFMEQGLGKTLTALCDFQDKVTNRQATRLVVVCPNSFKGGWVDEIDKWGFDFDNFVWEAGAAFRFKDWIKRGFRSPPVFICNYEAIRSKDVQELISSFIWGRDAMVVFDESIQIKTYDSQQTKAAIALSKLFTYRRILSGKPITQGPHDLWAQMRAIGALDGFRYHPFKATFCKMGGWKMKQVMGAQNEEYLASKIDPHVFRASKVDWTDLPPKVYTFREYEMSAAQKAQYRSMEDEFVLWLESGEDVSVDAAITKYIKLAQIQTGFILDPDGKVHELVKPEHNPRLRLLRDVLAEEVVGKSTIVYNHRHTYSLLSTALSEYNPAWIKGGMSEEEIRAQKEKFNSDPSCRVILLQTKAAKYGHTLLGEQGSRTNACSTSIVFENTYSLDDRSQIEDRIHRHGQKQESVLYVDLIGTSLDKRAVQALQRKENVFQAVFSKLKRHSSPER